MKLDYGRRCRLLDMRDNCYIRENLNREKVETFYKKVEEYRLDGFEVTIYELVAENLLSRLKEESKNE